MIDQQHDHIRLIQCRPDAGQAQLAGQLARQRPDVRLYGQHPAWMGRDDLLGDRDSGTLAQVVDVRLEGKAQAGDGHITCRFLRVGSQELGNGQPDLFDHPPRLAVVHFASGADQPSLFGGLADDEPGVDGNAVPAHARARLQDVDARMAVSQTDQFPYIDIEPVADHRQLVGEGDVEVTEAVLGQLAHFSCPEIGNDALTLDEELVQAGCDS
ncbi:hypothetical protein D9M70_501130 [compost metagenome]